MAYRRSSFGAAPFRAVLGVILLAATLVAGRAGAAELVMVEQPGCAYCRAWDEEIASAWPNTDEGAFAPLRREQLRDIPDDLDLARRVVFTPTFVVVNDAGEELGRLEGYPGAEFFWPLIEDLLAEKAGYDPQATD